ncbi:MAG: hypothetical protein QOI92_2321 [Chloroflexota bacterium]|jgi:subtilisin family serine protease|nr:hypothetical protein [Chloroflexota bacterium]
MTSRRQLYVAGAALAALVVGIVALGLFSRPPAPTPGLQIASVEQGVALGIIDQQVVDDVRAKADATAFVSLDVDSIIDRLQRQFPAVADRERLVETLEPLIASAKANLAAALGNQASVVTDFQLMSTVAVHFGSEEALLTAIRLPIVAAIRANRIGDATLDESKLIVDQAGAIEQGHGGEGTYVAVLDTGVDPGPYPAYFPTGSVMETYKAGDANGSALPYGHGTHVASIVLAMAPSTRILPIEVFNWATGAKGPQWSSDRISAGVEHVIALKRAWLADNSKCCNVVAMNLSLGQGGQYHDVACTDDFSFATAFSLGIVPVVSSGNDADKGTSAFTEGISYPACDPYAFSVGATTDGIVTNDPKCDDSTGPDQVVFFSQTAPILEMLAPGLCITAAGGSKQGTSMAAPFVAGAAALLASAKPSATGAEIWDALLNTGKPIADSRVLVPITKNRLNIADAERALVAGVTTPGTPAPAGPAYRVLVGPSRVDLAAPLAKGRTYDLPDFGLRNPLAESATFQLVVRGANGFGTDAPADWFTFDPPNVTLAAGASTLIGVRVTVPDGASAGFYGAQIGPDVQGGGLPAFLLDKGAAPVTFTVSAIDTDGQGTPSTSTSTDGVIAIVAVALVVLFFVYRRLRPSSRPPSTGAPRP